MRRRRPTPSRLVLLALVAVGVGGCGPQAEGDPGLAIYLSAPLSGPRAIEGRDAADGAALALEAAGGRAGDTAVDLLVRDDAIKSGWDAAATGANARTATQDSTAIAYIGELDSGASRTSIPITNEAGILHVSAGSGAEDLTREVLGSSNIPAVQPSGERTFGRVIPSDRAQGEAAATWMSDLGITSVEVVGAETEFGEALIAGLGSAASGPAVVSPNADAEAYFDAREVPFGESDSDPGSLATSPGPVFGSDALLPPGDPTAFRTLRRPCEPPSPCPPTRRLPLRLTSAALDPSQLPPAAATFLSDFEAAYGREPGRYAAYGYEAMALVIDSIGRAEDPLDRGDVVDAFFATRERDSILGTYSIDEVGNTTLPALGSYEVDESLRPVATREPLELP